MGRVIPNQVLRPRGEVSAPVFYLLNGRSGGVEGDSWLEQTDHRSFFAGKNVTVVSPLGGPYAWYADWQRPDPALGVNKWETYLLRELPGAISGPLRERPQRDRRSVPLRWSRARHRRAGRIALSRGGVVQRLPCHQCAARDRRRLRHDIDRRWQRAEHVRTSRIARVGRSRPFAQSCTTAGKGHLSWRGVGLAGTNRRCSPRRAVVAGRARRGGDGDPLVYRPDGRRSQWGGDTAHVPCIRAGCAHLVVVRHRDARQLAGDRTSARRLRDGRRAAVIRAEEKRE